MKWNRILYLDVKTTALDPTIANILEMAFVKEVNGGQVGEVQSLKIQPILHFEDKLYGEQPIESFCSEYNAQYHDGDVKCIKTFGFQGKPLFMYAKESLTCNLPAPKVADPSSWVLDKARMPAKKALMALIDYLDDIINPMDRWVLIGHNVKFHHDVLTWWATRLLGQKEADKQLLNKLNKFVTLDTLSLVRWFQYSGKVTSETAKLGDVASSLGICVQGGHNADDDVRRIQDIVWRLVKAPSDFEIPF